MDCPNACGAHFEKRFLEAHVNDDCTKRMVVCEFCDKKIFYKDEIAHMNACVKFPVPCPNGCKLTDIPREKVGARGWGLGLDDNIDRNGDDDKDDNDNINVHGHSIGIAK